MIIENLGQFIVLCRNLVAMDQGNILADPDNLPAQLIRDGAEQFAAILHFLANQSLRSGSFPGEMRKTDSDL